MALTKHHTQAAQKMAKKVEDAAVNYCAANGLFRKDAHRFFDLIIYHITVLNEQVKLIGEDLDRERTIGLKD